MFFQELPSSNSAALHGTTGQRYNRVEESYGRRNYLNYRAIKDLTTCFAKKSGNTIEPFSCGRGDIQVTICRVIQDDKTMNIVVINMHLTERSKTEVLWVLSTLYTTLHRLLSGGVDADDIHSPPVDAIIFGGDLNIENIFHGGDKFSRANMTLFYIFKKTGFKPIQTDATFVSHSGKCQHYDYLATSANIVVRDNVEIAVDTLGESDHAPVAALFLEANDILDRDSRYADKSFQHLFDIKKAEISSLDYKFLTDFITENRQLI